MRDRAMQALYLLALDPVAETTGDHHSYGFRRERSTADAIEQVRNVPWTQRIAEMGAGGGHQRLFRQYQSRLAGCQCLHGQRHPQKMLHKLT